MPARKRAELKPERLALILLVIVIAFFAWDRFRSKARLSDPKYLAELANSLQEESDIGQHAQAAGAVVGVGACYRRGVKVFADEPGGGARLFDLCNQCYPFAS